MESVTLFHYHILDDALHIAYTSRVKELMSKQNDVFYYELDNFSGEDVRNYAKLLAKESKSIILFIDCKTTTTDQKLATWLNFFLQLKQEKILVWQGDNAIIEQMKSAFDNKIKISDLIQLVQQINLQINRS